MSEYEDEVDAPALSYRERLDACHSRLKQELDRVERLKAALLRNRQGYVNILEMRKLSGEQWGQRDGYGGRYGALTREEIETVIAEIDKALA